MLPTEAGGCSGLPMASICWAKRSDPEYHATTAPPALSRATAVALLFWYCHDTLGARMTGPNACSAPGCTRPAEGAGAGVGPAAGGDDGAGAAAGGGGGAGATDGGGPELFAPPTS